jgi:hypothetical protein
MRPEGASQVALAGAGAAAAVRALGGTLATLRLNGCYNVDDGALAALLPSLPRLARLVRRPRAAPVARRPPSLLSRSLPASAGADADHVAQERSCSVSEPARGPSLKRAVRRAHARRTWTTAGG